MKPTKPLKSTIPNGKALAKLFFTLTDPETREWTCICGHKRKQSGSGYTNMESHIKRQHSTYVNLSTSLTTTPEAMRKFLVPSSASNMFGWIKWTCKSLLAFSFFANETTRDYSHLESICPNTLLKYMAIVCSNMEKKISAMLPEQFALVFDGWSSGSTHYVAIFASFPTSNVLGYEKVLLSFAPMNDECGLSADDHYDYASFVLDMFGKNWSNVVALVGDNCSTNGAFSARSKVPLIGCSSHRFNLAVNDILVNYEPILSDVHTLMTKLKTLIPAAKLRAFTPLQAVTRNKTRWSSTFAMLERYVAIRGSIGQIIDRDIQNLALSPRQDNQVDELLVILADLNTVTLALQCDDLTMQGVRDLFDTLLEDHPGMTSRLACNSKNVKNPDFEVGVVKILAGRESSLTSGEKKCVASLLRPTSPASGKNVESLTLDQRAKKRAKPGESLYVDCRFLCPKSNVCERFFSSARYALTDNRKCMLPQNFELQMFLYYNINFWGVQDVVLAMNHDTDAE